MVTDCPLGWAGGMKYHLLKNWYPVEIHCLHKELKEGIYTNPEKFAQLHAEKLQRKQALELGKYEQKSVS